MRSHTYIGIACIVGCALFVHLLPSTAEARHTDGRSSAFERKIRALGSTGASVSLLQFYLIYENAGPASQALGQAGATGYFGPVTASALIEYQRMHKADSTGVYDAQTRDIMQG